MEGIIIPGVPAEYAAIATTLIGIVSSLLVGPATAIAKKLWGTEGVSTVAISAALSFIVGMMWAAIGAASGGTFNIIQALTITAIAFVKANGDYISRAQANVKANKAAPPIAAQPAPAPQSPVTPPPGIEAGKPLPAEYVEPQTARKAPSLRIEK